MYGGIRPAEDAARTARVAEETAETIEAYARVLRELPGLARYRYTPGYYDLLDQARKLLDGDVRAEIEDDLWEISGDECDWEMWAEDAEWTEDEHGGAERVTFDDEDD